MSACSPRDPCRKRWAPGEIENSVTQAGCASAAGLALAFPVEHAGIADGVDVNGLVALSCAFPTARSAAAPVSQPPDARPRAVARGAASGAALVYRADLVVSLLDGAPVLGIVIEIQLSPDERKRFAWPAYVVQLRSRLELPVCLLVVTADEATARWAVKPIDLGGGNWFTPLAGRSSVAQPRRLSPKPRSRPKKSGPPTSRTSNRSSPSSRISSSLTLPSMPSPRCDNRSNSCRSRSSLPAPKATSRCSMP